MAFARHAALSVLLLVNFILYVAIAVTAGWALNAAIDHGWEVLSYNKATYYFVMFSLLSGVVGVGSGLAAVHNHCQRHFHTFASSVAVSFLSWLLTLVAMGLAWKQIGLGGFLSTHMVFLEAVVITAAITHAIYLLGIHIMCFCCGDFSASQNQTMVEPSTTPPVKA
ncbi:hypothetical protein KP509_03G035800 [Ceratopteris richardii]|uniref:Uncharacterized protein n=1 Tax=Ceratopteris richardii TaxID=49495 RepID=A0A8T2V321_CERRI|nr:hypothetical protein KP509_03G035800 [Ceratopteris richardii]